MHDLHLQLQVLVRERLYARHGIVAEEEAEVGPGRHPTRSCGTCSSGCPHPTSTVPSASTPSSDESSSGNA